MGATIAPLGINISGVEMARIYNSEKPIAPSPKPRSLPSAESRKLQPWTDGKLLHSLKQASEILNEVLGGGYSEKSIQRRIKGEWVEGVQFVRDGRSIKVKIRAVIEQIENSFGGIK